MRCAPKKQNAIIIKNGSRYKFSEKAIRIFLKFTRTDGTATTFYIAFFMKKISLELMILVINYTS